MKMILRRSALAIGFIWIRLCPHDYVHACSAEEEEEKLLEDTEGIFLCEKHPVRIFEFY